jgi:hypothetical protein
VDLDGTYVCFSWKEETLLVDVALDQDDKLSEYQIREITGGWRKMYPTSMRVDVPMRFNTSIESGTEGVNRETTAGMTLGEIADWAVAWAWPTALKRRKDREEEERTLSELLRQARWQARRVVFEAKRARYSRRSIGNGIFR